MRTRRLLLPAAVALFVAALAPDAHALPPWVDRTITLPQGDWAFDAGLGVHRVPPPDFGDNAAAGINLEMAVGITDRLELGVRTGIRFGNDVERGLQPDLYGRLFDREYVRDDRGNGVLANPELRIRGALVRGDVFELGLEGRFFVPIEPVGPQDGTYAAAEFGVPMAFHFGNRVRLDTGVYQPILFTPDPRFDLSLPLNVWIQASPRVWVGPMTGLFFQNVFNARDTFGGPGTFTALSLGAGFGYQITQYLDFKAMFLFPEVNHDGGDFGLGAGVQIRIE